MPTTDDAIGLLLVYGYVSVVVLIAKSLEKRGICNCERKVIHILVGNIVFFWWIFDTPYIMAFLAAGPFIPLLYIVSPHSPFKRFRRTFLADATAGGHDLGLVYYAISWTVLAFLFFDHRVAASIGIVSMAYGDGVGGLIGSICGRRAVIGEKTLEGSIAVLITTAVVSAAVMLFYAALDRLSLFVMPPHSMEYILIVSAVVGGYVALMELITPGKYDNLIIPLSTALIALAMGV